ncbi:MAG: hypothetical protein ABII18_00755 [bacterium]|nr:hypothetical protein [bacterium]MBU1917313.1 hypothetical protein [bacterium]
MKTLIKTNTLILILLISFLTINCGTVTGSEDNDDGETGWSETSTACVGLSLVEITSDIDTNTTWNADTIYVIRKYDFYVNATLVIKPGAIIKFHTSDGPYMMLGETGTINAQGTEDNPIVFTSFRDDTQGCDNNGDGLASTPAANDWGGVDTNGLNGSIFDYCEFYYGGDTAYNATLSLSAGSVATVTNSLFVHNDGGDATEWYGALNASDADANTVIQNNTFYDNNIPLSISVAFDLDDSNSFENPDDSTETNTYNGIFVDSINHISTHIEWSEDEVPYVIDDNDFWINSGASLTLTGDVALKFRPDSVLLLEDGTSQIIMTNTGNDEQGDAVFTSYKDDTVKGDTNADGSDTSPADGDWGGIYDDTAAAPYYLSWSNIFYDDIH